MSDQDKHDDSQASGRQGDAPVIEGLSEVVGAVFGVGAAVAKTLAEATAGGRPVAAPESDQGALGEMVHYGISVVSNVIGLAVSTMGKAVPGGSVGLRPGPAAKEKEDAPTQPAEKKGLPLVHQGGTLRIPLSIENPGDQPMQDLAFCCQQMTGKRLAAGIALTEQAVRFQPQRLEIAPRDFEKLTLFIDTDERTAPGRYAALIGVGDGGMELKVEFDVALAEQTS